MKNQVRACSFWGIAYGTQLLLWSVRDKKQAAMVDFWNRQASRFIKEGEGVIKSCDEKLFRARWPNHKPVKIGGFYVA